MIPNYKLFSANTTKFHKARHLHLVTDFISFYSRFHAKNYILLSEKKMSFLLTSLFLHNQVDILPIASLSWQTPPICCRISRALWSRCWLFGWLPSPPLRLCLLAGIVQVTKWVSLVPRPFPWSLLVGYRSLCRRSKETDITLNPWAPLTLHCTLSSAGF